MKVFVELDQADGTAHIEWEGETFTEAFAYLSERMSKFELPKLRGISPSQPTLDLAQPAEIRFSVDQGDGPINLKALRIRTEATPVDTSVQCDYQVRHLYSSVMTGCDEPAKFNCRVWHVDQCYETTVRRCSQHGEQLRNYIRDSGGWTPSGKVRIMTVEEIQT